MKLRNKKTGKVIEWFNNTDSIFPDTLAELNEEWEDYEDDDLSKIIEWIDKGLEYEILPISVNDFVEKLEAWKRLKDKGFKLEAVVDSFFCLDIFMKGEPYEEIKEDLKIIFGE